MDSNRIVAGLNVHKDTIYLCVLDNTETIIFANVYGTLTPNLQPMCSDMVSHGVTEAAMDSGMPIEEFDWWQFRAGQDRTGYAQV